MACLTRVLGWGVLPLAALGMCCAPSVQADVQMKKNFEQFIPIKVMTEASTATAQPGDAFEIRIMDDIVYDGKTVPAGSTLTGHVTETREPKRWGRPARFLVRFEELRLGYATPEPQEAIALNAPDDQKALKKFQAAFLEDNRHTRKSIFSRQAMVGLVANAITVPISLVSNQGFVGAYILDETVDAAVGIAEEFRYKDPNDTRSKGRKVAEGVLRGTTPIPLMVGMVRKGGHLAYEEETPVYLRFPKPLMTEVFDAVGRTSDLADNI